MVKRFLSQIMLANLLVCNMALAIVADFEETYYLRQAAFVESNRKEILFSTDKPDWSTRKKAIGSIRYVLSKEVPHIVARYDTLGQLTPEGIEGLRNDIYGITSGHFQVWGLSSALTAKKVPYFNGSYIDALIAVFNDDRLALSEEGVKEFRKRHREVRYYWKEGKGQAIDNIKDVIRRYRPHIINRYDKLNKLTPEGIEGLRNDIYRITQGHFRVWGLNSALIAKKVPYFNGSYIDALIAVFPKLNLTPLGFQLDWSTKEKAIGSIRYVLSKEVPHIVARYDTLGQLTPEGIEGLRNDIYGITSGHFRVWGLGGILNARAVPYFNGRYLDALLNIFDGPKLGLRRDGFLMAHGLLNTMPRPAEVMSNI